MEVRSLVSPIETTATGHPYNSAAPVMYIVAVDRHLTRSILHTGRQLY